MPKIINNWGVKSVVSVKRANEMIQAGEGRLVNEPDMLAGDPIEERVSRSAPPSNLVKPTNAQLQDIAAKKEEKTAEQKKELNARELEAKDQVDALKKNSNPLVLPKEELPKGLEFSDAATPEEALNEMNAKTVSDSIPPVGAES